MNNKTKWCVASSIFLTIGLVFLMANYFLSVAADLRHRQSSLDNRAYIVNKGDVLVRFEKVENHGGELVGFHCEVINNYKDKNIVLTLSASGEEYGRIALQNHQGDSLTPPPAMQVGGRVEYVLIAPHGGYSWLMKLPSEMFVDPVMKSETTPLLPGNYEAVASAFITYRVLRIERRRGSVEMADILKQEHKFLIVDSPVVSVVIGADSLYQDVFSVYTND